ncbi:MinD-like ATPase involved in chromosome partitioning or flagellar assembly (plasmid) [Carboxydocella thermautotrophica]|nr:MinD-like ATPase involved in chromosome partitioning or flagellar assembly [Carboxydocella thermautotrophica]
MEKYVVITQDRSIFKIFQEALGIEPMKISSALAAKTLLQDKENAFDLVAIDIDLKDADSVVKLVNRRKMPLIKIGEDLVKPVTEEAVKEAVKDKLATPPEKPSISKTRKKKEPIKKQEPEEQESDNSAVIQDDLIPITEEVHNEMLAELEQIWNVENGKSKETLEQSNNARAEAEKWIEQNIKRPELQDEEELISRIKAEVLSQIKEESLGADKAKQDEQEKQPAETRVKIARQLVAAVWSAKPGIGKTFITVNLGVIYAQAGFKTVIIDGDILNLSVGIHLNLMDMNQTLEKALKETNPLKIKDYLLQHPKIPNLYVISGSEICRPENYTGFAAGSMARIINTLREHYDVILIDTATDPTFLTTYEALKTANKVLVVTSLDHTVTFNTKKYLDLLKKINIAENKFCYVLNKDFPSNKVNKEIVEKSLGIMIDNVIPNAYEKVTESIFDSKPIMLYNTPATQQIRDALVKLAADIYPYIAGPKPPEKETFFAFLKKWLRGRAS